MRADRRSAHEGPGRHRRLSAALIASLCIALLAGSAWVAQGAGATDPFPQLPPPPAPEDDPGGNGSVNGYPDATATQAANLFTTEFSSTIDSLAQDPPDLAGEHPDFLNNYMALISPDGKSPAELSQEIQGILDRNRHDLAGARAELDALLNQHNGGPSKLVSSVLPLRVTEGGGQPAPVDLSLDQQGGAYVPENPLVDLSLPGNLSNDVAVGDQGIQIDVGANAGATARTLAGDESLFYPEADTDTDIVLAPLSVGVETFYQLRSPLSPERFEMEFSLPAGASLQASAGEGATIVKDGNTLARIPAPGAQDAAGNPIAVTTSVNGDSLELSVPHREADASYPINVDPVTDVYTGTGSGITAFSADWTAGQSSGSPYTLATTCTQNVSCTSGTTGPRGLYVNAPPNQTYGSSQSATWLYKTPHYPTTTAYISSIGLGPITYSRHSGTATNPYLAAGIFSPDPFSWVSTITQQGDGANLYWTLAPPNQQVAPNGKMAVFQLYSAASQTLNNWRHAFLGGAEIELGDTETASESLNAGPLTQGWIDGNQTVTFPVDVEDGGIGVKGVYGPGPDGYATTRFPNENNPSQGDCVGTHASPCPQSEHVTAGYYPGRIPEGQSVSSMWVWDALGKTSAQVWNVRVDASPPQISTSGGLSQSATGDPYALHVDAIDGSTTDPAAWRSGVKKIEVRVGGDTVADTGVHECTGTAGSCPLSLDYTLNPSDYAVAQHPHVKVIATDELGHTQTREWDATVPADTADPALTVSGSLRDAPSGWVDQGSYEVRASAHDTTSGIHQVRLLIDETEVAQVAQTCPSGGCSLEHTFAVDTTNLTGGTHSARVVTTDAAGHPTAETWEINVNPGGEISAAEAHATFQAGAPAAIASSEHATIEDQVVDPGLAPQDGELRTTDSIAQAHVGMSFAEGVQVGFGDFTSSLTPVDRTDRAPTLVDDVALYPSTSVGVDTVVRPTATGVVIVEQLRQESAPNEFGWTVALSSNQYLQEMDDGSVAVVQPFPDDSSNPSPLPEGADSGAGDLPIGESSDVETTNTSVARCGLRRAMREISRTIRTR